MIGETREMGRVWFKMKEQHIKNRKKAPLKKFLLVFLSMIQFAAGGGIASAENEIWTDITGSENFSLVSGVAADNSGNVYVADANANQIKKLSNGTWTDITGSGDFNSPFGIAADNSGNVYVADTLNNKIKKLSNGIWTDITGLGDFLSPCGIAVDSSGIVYVTDTANYKIKKLLNGAWVDITGSGDFLFAFSIAADNSGNVYVADVYQNNIKKLSNGTWTEITDSGYLYSPSGVAADNFGNVYVADTGNDKIKKLSSGIWTDITGLGDLRAPSGIAVDSSGNVYVTNFILKKINKLSMYNVTYLAGDHGTIRATGEMVAYGSYPGAVPEVTPSAGYAFAGWSTDGGTTLLSSANVAAAAITGNITYTAYYKVNSYTVTYAEGDHGTISATGETVAHGSHPAAVPTVTPSTGYAFAGWSTDGGTTLLSSADVAATAITGNIAYTAYYTVSSYTVTYAEGDHGTISATGETVAHGSHPAAVPTVTPSTGYAFAGWSTDGGTTLLSSADVAATAITGNIAYTAYYTVNSYTISFNSNEGSAVASQSVTYKGYATQPTAPTRTGYTFEDWYADTNMTAVFNFASSAITADITLYAKWSMNKPDMPLIQSIISDESNVTIHWTGVPEATGYNIYQSNHSGSYGNPITTVSGTVYSYQTSGLTNGIQYYFIVKAVNAGGESDASNEVSATPITIPAAPTDIAAVASNGQATITFAVPTDNGGNTITEYEVTTSPGNTITRGTASPITVTGLANGTTYTFTVKAINSAGSSAASEASNAVTPIASSGGSSSPSAQPFDSGVLVLINGQAADVGTASTTKNEQTTSAFTLDEKKLNEKLASAGEGSIISISFTTISDAVMVELNGQIVKSLEQKNAVVEIKTESASYTLPLQQIHIHTLSDQLGGSAALQDIKVQIEIAKPENDALKILEKQSTNGEFTIIAPPLRFTVKAAYKDQTIEVSNFDTYVERTITIPNGIDPNLIATGVVVDLDGTIRHMPTQIMERNGKYDAKISSMSNSTYSVIGRSIAFKDVENHWAKQAVNDMGARMIISGTGTDIFSPDRDITRAEFAAIIVRALGLKPDNEATPFSDVKATDWYSGALNAAYAYDLISGFEDGTYRPNDKITREQTTVIIAKAMMITDLKAKLAVQSINETLHTYTDASEVSAWAQNSMADSVLSGIVTGRSAAELAPKAYITRAEVAMIVQRLLQKSELI